MRDSHNVTNDQINQAFRDLLDEDYIMNELSLQNISNEKILFFHRFFDVDQLEFDESKCQMNKPEIIQKNRRTLFRRRKFDVSIESI
jgi:hypothetical protein